MKRSLLFFCTSLAFGLGLVPANLEPMMNRLGSQPVLAESQQQKLEVLLVGQLRVVEKNWRGEEKITWRSLESDLLRAAPTVKPGDILRYIVSGTNHTEKPIAGLVLTDDLPPNTVFVMGSAASVGNATITYSIDGGKTYTASPTIKVTLPNGKVENRPAPAERYTHVRWTFQRAVPAKSTVNGQYQVRVQ